MKIRLFLVAAISLLIGWMVSPRTAAQDTGWYIGAGAGNSDPDPSVLEDTTGVKLFGGYNFNKNFALEGAYVDLGESDIEGVPGGEVEADGVQIVGVGHLPVGEKISVFGKVGFYNWDAEATVPGFPSLSGSDDGTDATFGIGVQFGSGRWAGRVEFERFDDISGIDVDLLSASFMYSPGKARPRAPARAAPPPEPKPVEIEMPTPTVAPPPPAPAKPEPVIPELAAAEQGDVNAQYKVGYMYSTGQGVPKNDAEAVKWYRKAAEQGHARAQYNLGAAYANGTGVRANRETAVNWLFRAGRSFIRQGNRDLALRAVDTMERLIPGHVLAGELLAAIRAKFGQ